MTDNLDYVGTFSFTKTRVSTKNQTVKIFFSAQWLQCPTNQKDFFFYFSFVFANYAE